jgi:transposase
MGQHASAHLTVHSRLTICRRVTEEGWTIVAASRAAGVHRHTVSKWVRRFQAEGPGGLQNRSTRPHRIPRHVPAELVGRIEDLRRQRLGSHRIAWMLGMARSTVYKVLRRLGLSRLSRLEPRPAPNRYEWPAPGDLLHLDTKKLGRIGSSTGWRFDRSQKGRSTRLGWVVVHVAIDDHSRLAYVEELPDEAPETTVAFFYRALGFYAAHGISVRRVLTDNGKPLPLARLLPSDGRARDPAHQDPALHTSDERQGGGHGEDPHQRLGLRQRLRERRGTISSPAVVRRVLQSRASTWRLERRPTDRTGPAMMCVSGTARRREPDPVGFPGPSSIAHTPAREGEVAAPARRPVLKPSQTWVDDGA